MGDNRGRFGILNSNSGVWRATTFCLATMIVSLLTILLISTASMGSNGESSPPETYKLPPPGDDPRIALRSTGEEMFFQRNFAEAREAFQKLLNIDNRDAQAHYFLGLIEYELGNAAEAKSRFQTAYECLEEKVKIPDDAQQSKELLDSDKVQMEFPDEFEVNMYYKDGWYVSPKTMAAYRENAYKLDTGSNYRVEVKSEGRESWVHRGVVGLVVLFSFLLAR